MKKGLGGLPQEKQMQILFGIFGLVGIAVWWNLLIAPRRQKLASIVPEVAALRDQIEQTKQGLREMSSMEARIAELSNQPQGSAASVPTAQQLPEVLDKIAQAARKGPVKLVTARPHSDIKTLAPAESGYLEPLLYVVVSGGYHQMGKFLDELERSDVLVKVKEFGITGDEEDLYNHQAYFLLQTYLMPSGDA